MSNETEKTIEKKRNIITTTFNLGMFLKDNNATLTIKKLTWKEFLLEVKDSEENYGHVTEIHAEMKGEIRNNDDVFYISSEGIYWIFSMDE